MSRNFVFNAVIASVLVVLAGMTVLQFAASSEVVSAESEGSLLAARPEGKSEEPASGLAGRTDRPLDGCFDVPLREAANCRQAGQEAHRTSGGRIRTPGATLDVCFDVPLREACDG